MGVVLDNDSIHRAQTMQEAEPEREAADIEHIFHQVRHQEMLTHSSTSTRPLIRDIHAGLRYFLQDLASSHNSIQRGHSSIAMREEAHFHAVPFDRFPRSIVPQVLGRDLSGTGRGTLKVQ